MRSAHEFANRVLCCAFFSFLLCVVMTPHTPSLPTTAVFAYFTAGNTITCHTTDVPGTKQSPSR